MTFWTIIDYLKNHVRKLGLLSAPGGRIEFSLPGIDAYYHRRILKRKQMAQAITVTALFSLEA